MDEIANVQCKLRHGNLSVICENPGGDVSAIVEDYPKFVAMCIRIAQAIRDRVDSLSVKFTWTPRAPHAEVAWRNEIFAVLHSWKPWLPDSAHKGHLFLSDTKQEVYRDKMCTEEQALLELSTLLRMHLARILKGEERIRHAREALARIGV